MAGTRKDKKAIQAYVDAGVWRQLRIMAMDSDKTLQELIAEILGDAVAKGGRKAKGDK